MSKNRSPTQEEWGKRCDLRFHFHNKNRRYLDERNWERLADKHYSLLSWEYKC